MRNSLSTTMLPIILTLTCIIFVNNYIQIKTYNKVLNYSSTIKRINDKILENTNKKTNKKAREDKNEKV